LHRTVWRMMDSGCGTGTGTSTATGTGLVASGFPAGIWHLKCQTSLGSTGFQVDEGQTYLQSLLPAICICIVRLTLISTQVALAHGKYAWNFSALFAATAVEVASHGGTCSTRLIPANICKFTLTRGTGTVRRH